MPSDSKQTEMWGTVVLSVKILEDGRVEDARIIKPADEALNLLALANPQESALRFIPAICKGQPVIVRAKVKVRFWTCANQANPGSSGRKPQ